MTTILAVDGGNSKTDVVLLDGDGTVLAVGRGPGFEPQKTGAAVAVDSIAEAVRQAIGPAEPPYADHVVAYVAGADLPRDDERLAAEIIARRYARSDRFVVVSNDTFALLRAGTSSPYGVAVVCGAGINAVGVAPGGTYRFLSLGEISGDFGGGMGLGTRVIWHAIRDEDGRGPATSLTGVVRACFGKDTVSEVCVGLHYRELDIQRLNDLIPGLMAEARAGDPVAYELIERMADEVVTMAVAVMRRLDLLAAPTEVVLGGGLMTARDELLGGLIEAKLAARAPLAVSIISDMSPLAGAALIGLDRIGAGADAQQRLRSYFGAVGAA